MSSATSPELRTLDAPAVPPPGSQPISPSEGQTLAAPLPTVSLPRGGGALRGIGEKFGTNPVTGTGAFTVPLPTSPGRGGFAPNLALTYDSGSGNGVFGLGWSLSVSAVSRKTDDGLPRYEDVPAPDTFLLTGSDDLVPELDGTGEPYADDEGAPGFVIHRFRPRIEGLFARIERWTQSATGDVHWRSITRENVTTLYGRDNRSRIFDPADTSGPIPTRIFQWLICESFDDKGNAIAYEYLGENDANVRSERVNERNRSHGANRYLKRIKYGNRAPLSVGADLAAAEWLFEVVFDYGEGHLEALPPDPARAIDEQLPRVRAASTSAGSWPVRPDPFSTYRSGFEIRCHRRCQRVLMFHRFAELGAEPCLVRETAFEYADLDDSAASSVDELLGHPGSTRWGSFLRTVTQSGFVRDQAAPVTEHDGVRSVTYIQSALPPLEFEYTRPRIGDEVRRLDDSSLRNAPTGLHPSRQQWVDLDGEGLSGLLSEQAGAWFYKRNLGEGRFGPAQALRSQPTMSTTAGGNAQLMDLSGDGQMDVVQFDGPLPGFFERTQDQSWLPFRTFRSLPKVRWDEPNLTFVDLDGDGQADLLVTEHEALTWYPSLGEDGFGPARRVPTPTDEEKGPRLVLQDGLQSIFLADMSGDGLTDLVRIRNTEICYWPNLGYGRFGAKVTMDDAPRFDRLEQFDARRVRLADIDGSGTTDLIYLGPTGPTLYFNQCGNGWSAARPLPQFGPIADPASLTTADLLGNGTACLIHSSALPNDARSPVRFVDLMDGQKPHLLHRSRNNLGAETHITYAPSTRFYLADEQRGLTWKTRAPFPVHVVERVVTLDHVSGNRFVTRYAYHHAHFDGADREFRGFGMVEQWDTEELAAREPDGTWPEATNLDAASHVPPVYTKSWFHTGVFMGRDHVSDYFAGLTDDPDDTGEYFRPPGSTQAAARAQLLPDTVLPSDLSVEEEQEACRALKGSLLRQEVYALDGTVKEEIPYTIAEQTFTVQRLQPRVGTSPAVFITHLREAVTTHHERNVDDPRISHLLNLEVDAFGNVLRELSVSYGRRSPSPDPRLTAEDRQLQARSTLVYTERRFTHGVSSPQHHRAPMPAESRAWELTGFAPEDGGARFTFEEWIQGGFAKLSTATDLAWEATPSHSAPQRRLIAHERTLLRRDDLTGLLPLGELEPLALPGESYKLAFTPSLVSQAFQRPLPGAAGSFEPLLPSPGPLLEGTGPDGGGYVLWDGAWWAPSGRLFFDPAADAATPSSTAAQERAAAQAGFYLPRKRVDAFGASNVVHYDAVHLLVRETRDPVGNVTQAVNDYRVLQPAQVTDINGNRTAVAFDAQGRVVASALMGKEGELRGDLLAGFQPDLTLADLRRFIADPVTHAAAMLGQATSRIVTDPHRFRRTGQPVVTAILSRQRHVHVPPDEAARFGDGPAPPPQIALSWSDGFGREIQKKLQAEPGTAYQRGAPLVLPTGDVAPGPIVRDSAGLPTTAPTAQRWIGTGRTVLNNKGKPVRQYEPFFSATPLHEPEREMTELGISPVLFYDPIQRLVATLRPNATYEKIVFDAWQQTTFDLNDTAAPHGEQTGDPRTDPDIHGLVRAFFTTQPATWQTWRAARIGGASGAAERDAAEKTAAHANTPTTAHLDPLGRTFVTLVHNRYDRSGTTIDAHGATRVTLDVQGNQRAVRDEKGRTVMRYAYNLLGHRLLQSSMESADRWMLSDVSGNAIRTWDTRGALRRLTYDALRRQTGLYVTENGAERCAERVVYGEGQGAALNHRGQIHQRFDAAGVVTSVAYDFKGNLLESRRELLADYKTGVDWQASPPTNDGSFTHRSVYDALNRLVAHGLPDGSEYRPVYNEANLLERLELRPPGASSQLTIVSEVDYDAQGRRRRITYGNGTVTHQEYDPETSRLVRLTTSRPASVDGSIAQLFASTTVVQDLRYTYDPVGNVTRLEDAALRTVFHAGEQVEPVSAYVYDAAYRLIEARGREHAGQTTLAVTDPSADPRHAPFAGPAAHPNDLQALRRYVEQYEYDACGNFERFRHSAQGQSWSREYRYQHDSAFDAGAKTNRLTGSAVGNGGVHDETYTHDAHGNITALPHLQRLVWDFKDQLQRVDLGGGGVAWYVYDGAGQRVRKVVESQQGARQRERVYLGAFERHRAFEPDGTTVREQRNCVSVMDGAARVAVIETLTVSGGAPIASPTPLQRFQLGDQHGSTTLELDGASALITYEAYHPYGTTSLQAGRSSAEVNLKRHRYSGKERDEETGLCYHGARYYAPWLGRWISAEPGGLVDTTNLYLFVRANPVVLRDDDGNIPDNAVGDRMFDRMVGVPDPPPPAPPDPLEQAARLHGEVEGRLGTLSREIQELYESRVSGAPLRFWSMDHFFAAAGFPDPILERGARAQEMVEAGVAEEGSDDYWHSTVLERSIENGLITNQADQERFLQIAERERQGVVIRWALWRAVEMVLALTPVRGTGAGGMLFARAPQSAPAALNALNAAVHGSGVTGRYVNVIESMSARAIAFQELVSGGIRAGTSFLRNGVKFDFLDTARRLLVDAKGPGYAGFVNAAGDFYSWFRGRQTLVDQATRQLRAAGAEAIEWVFAEQRAMDATRRLFQALPASHPIRQAMASGKLTMRVH